ncbi:MAG: DUF111 family protein, partial [Candidatus Coatesbacteria bacterium]|nr:DUF111 family protein [Candidatus Coatesbacteria bacterium]
VNEVSRTKLMRGSFLIETGFGSVEVKIGTAFGKVLNVAPEFESCKLVAERAGVSLDEVYKEAATMARKQIGERE